MQQDTKYLQQENKKLQNKIRQLQIYLNTLAQESNKSHNIKDMQNNHINDSTQTQDKNNSSSIQYSPIHTCEQLQSEGLSIDMQQTRSPIQRVTQSQWGKTLFQVTGQQQQQKNNNKEKSFTNLLQSQKIIRQRKITQPQLRRTRHFPTQKEALSDILQCNHTVSQSSKKQQEQQCSQSPVIHMPSLQTLKIPTLQQVTKKQKNLKKSIQLPPTFNRQPNIRINAFYNSAIKQKNNYCEQCLNRMNQLHEMEFLKNKYHKEYIALRAQMDQIKHNNNLNLNSNVQNNLQSEIITPRSSLNLIDFYGEPLLYNNNLNYNDQKSQKSSFSFENIQNTLLSERFALQMEECIKLADRLLLVDQKCIELSQADCKLLTDFEEKIERLKYHIGLETEPKFLEDLFFQLDKSEVTIKNIHEKYRKLIQKLCKSYKQRTKRMKEEFNQVNQVMILTLKDFSKMKIKNQKLQSQIQTIKGQLNETKDMRSTNIGHQVIVRTLSQTEKQSNNLKELINNNQMNAGNIQRGPNHVTILPIHCVDSHLQKSSISSCQFRTQKQFQKLQTKLKLLQRQYKISQKTIKQLRLQLAGMKKKALSDFNQFINAVICRKQEKQRNIGVGTQDLEKIGEQRSSQKLKRSSNYHPQSYRLSQNSHQPLIQTLSTLIYQIFSFTSLETDELTEGIFQPETQQELIQMLEHIKQFTSKFDKYEKEKERQIFELRKNFLHLLKFFIHRYKIPQEELLQEIQNDKSGYNNQPLVSYIKNYYLRSGEFGKESDKINRIRITKHRSYSGFNEQNTNERESSEFTFGQKSQSCKDSEIEQSQIDRKS